MPATPASSVAAPVLPARRRKTLLERINEHRTVYLLLVLAYYLLFRYWPIGLSLVVSFTDLSIGHVVLGSEWVGLGNFIEIFSQPGIVWVIRNTFEISLLHILFWFLPPILLAILFHDMVLAWFRKTTQTIVYIPHCFSWVIIWGIVFAVFSSTNGLVNYRAPVFHHPAMTLSRYSIERLSRLSGSGYKRFATERRSNRAIS